MADVSGWKRMIETQKLSFDVDAALLVELGERLVARRSIAIAELIKNAYDADATRVEIRFDGVTGSEGQIVIADNGIGMTLKDMKRGWMRIATTDADTNRKSKRFGRPRTGAKGVGRFACRRLASKLSLKSVARVPAGSERITAEFDWTDFKPGLDLDDVETVVNREVVPKQLPTGTTLSLSKLATPWASSDMDEMQAELGLLMDPSVQRGYVQRDPTYEPDPGFDPHIVAPEFPRYEGNITNRFLGAAWGILTGMVSEKGDPEYTLRIPNRGQTLIHRPQSFSFADTVGARFTIWMMVYAGNRFRSSGYSLNEARKIGRERGGVKIYLDGFQVFSYGAPGDDWLDLDVDRGRRITTTPDYLSDEAIGLERPMLLLPANYQLFGAVAISREQNANLEVSISRERLVQSEASEGLKRFVRAGIDWMTVCYARELAATRGRRRLGNRKDQTALDALKVAQELFREETGMSTVRKQAIEQTLDNLAILLAEERAHHISELSMLRVLASAGTAVLVLDHTMRAMVAQLDTHLTRLEDVVAHLACGRDETAKQVLDDLQTWAIVATEQGSLVGLLAGNNSRTRKTSLAVRPLVDRLVHSFDAYLTRFGIRVENAIAPHIRAGPLYEAELYAVLLNLLTNSFKAVRATTNRRIKVDALVTDSTCTLRVHDTGMGVPIESREEVFEPFVTTGQPDPVLGVGTGLGLKIVRDLCQGWGGDVHFVNPMGPWRTSIEVVIPFGDDDAAHNVD